jgi:hypothetical protein
MFGLRNRQASSRPFDDSMLQQIVCRNGDMFQVTDDAIVLEGTTDRGQPVMLHIRLDGTQRQELITYGCKPRS